MQQLNNILVGNKKYHFAIFLLILLALSTLMMLCYKPLCPGQDFHFHFQRFNALMDALKHGTFPHYIDYQAIDGYGYLTRAFYSDSVLIPFAIIGNLTTAVLGYQSMLFTITALCGIFTYITINSIYRNTLAASISAILYTFCTYRLLDMYHRAALGETLSFTFLPIVFLGLYHIIKGDYKKWYLLAVGYSLMIFSHVISSVLMAVTIFIFLLIYNKSLRSEPKRVLYLCTAGIVTILLTAYYTFPMLEQILTGSFYYQTNNIMALAEHSDFGTNWIFWGIFGGGVQPRQIFIPGIGLLLTVAVCVRLFVHGKSKELRSADVLVMIGVCYVISISNLVSWSIFPLNMLNFIQLPWRLFEFISFFFAVAGAIYLSKALTSTKRVIVACALIVLSSAFFMASDGELYKGTRCLGDIDEKPSINNKYHMGGLEYIPSGVLSIEFIANRGRDSISSKSPISDYNRENDVIKFKTTTPAAQVYELPLLFYKGYYASLDGTQITVRESVNGLVEIDTKELVSAADKGEIKIYYAGTIVQTIGYWLTIISILALILYIVMEYRKTRHLVGK